MCHLFQVSGIEGRPTELNLQPEVTVWGDISTGTTPSKMICKFFSTSLCYMENLPATYLESVTYLVCKFSCFNVK